MTCDEVKEYLYEYYALKLGKDLFIQVDEHLKTCERCQQELRELEETITMLNRTTPPKVSKDFKDKIMARCEFSAVPFYKKRPYRMVMQGVVAAIVVFAVVTTIFISRTDKQSTTRGTRHGKTAEYACAEATKLYNESRTSSDLAREEKLLNDALSQRCEDKKVQAKIYNNLANCYEKQGRIDSAIKGYENSIALDPELSYPHMSLGDIYKKKGLDKEAEKYYRIGKQLEEKENLSKK
jgi:tetratricopeptide (TPR) repeat protein